MVLQCVIGICKKGATAGSLGGPTPTGDGCGGAGHDPLDLVIGETDEPRLSVLAGHGDGTFSAPQQSLVVPGLQGGFSDVALANVNADGRLDLIAASPGDQSLIIALGDAPLHFAAPTVIPIDTAPLRLIAQDVTRDAIADVVVATSDGLRLLRGNRDGSFEVSRIGELSDLVADVAIADVDGDRLADVVAALPSKDALQVFRGRPDGGFSTGGLVPVDEPVALAVGELTGDMQFDVAVASARSRRIVVLPREADGLGAPVTVAEQVSATDLFSADLNGDARQDLLAVDAATGEIRVLIADEDQTFTEVPTSAGLPGGGVALADFDCDGVSDVGIAPPGPLPSGVVVQPPVAPAPTPCAGDCDHDAAVGVEELIAGIRISLGDKFIACAPGDSNGDGRIDVTELLKSVRHSLDGCARE